MAIVTYLLFMIVIGVVLYYNLNIKVWSAINMALIAGLVYLVVIYPPTDLILDQEPVMIVIYLGVLALTPVILVIYALTKGLFDYRGKVTVGK